MTDRSTILREMGLTPIWTSRTPGSDPHVVDAVLPHSAIDEIVAAVQIPAIVTASPAVHDDTQTAHSAPNEMDREAEIAAMSWDELIASIARCTACKLSATRTKTVPGTGDRSPAWMIIGEAPGENEDRLGEPFVGKAGHLLDAMLAAVGKKRGAAVYIANVIKCRPPGNRNPEAAEIKACEPYLKRQIDLAKPRLLLATGKFAAQTLLNREDTVAAMRSGTGQYEGIPVIVTYHPSYLLRAPLEKAKAWDDLLKARAIVP
jgi:DNA polymerase